MKGVLRVGLLQFTALPVQRWLLGCGAVMVAAGYLLPPPGTVLGLIGLFIAFVPTLFASGVLLRYISAPRVMQLIPHVRWQILGGMVLVPLIIATAFTILAMSLTPKDDHALLWLRIAAGVSVLLISQFVLIAGARGTGFWFLILILAAMAPGTTATRDSMHWIGNSPGLLGTVLALSWCGFAIWFLRGRPLSAPRITSMVGWGTQNARTSQPNAVRAFLFGDPSLTGQFTTGMMAVVFMILSFGLMAWLNGSAHSPGEIFMNASWKAIGIGAYAGIGGWLVTRRSKFLWLRCGLDRQALYRLCEREAWVSLVATASGTFLLVPLVWLIGAVNPLEFAALLAIQLCSGACLLYLGLMRVRGWKLIDVLSSLALFIAWGLASVSGSFLAGHLWLVLAICVAILAAALGLRLIGLYRWQRIDWLVCKPPSPLARNEMNPA